MYPPPLWKFASFTPLYPLEFPSPSRQCQRNENSSQPRDRRSQSRNRQHFNSAKRNPARAKFALDMLSTGTHVWREGNLAMHVEKLVISLTFADQNP